MNIKAFFDGMAVFLSINIITWFTWALYYGIKTIVLYRKRKEKLYFTTYFPLVVSFLFILAFWYIIIIAATGSPAIDNSSFGAVILRPLILLTAVGTAIAQLEKYRRERNK